MRLFSLFTISLLGCATSSSAPQAPEPREEHAHGHDWNDTYVRGTGFNTKPNALLASVVERATPGTALDVGMGQGRNAVFLAQHQWRVTGVDTATEGVRLAKEAAARAKVPLDGIVADVDTFDMGTAKYDLVALMYVGGAELAERVKTALKPGGRVVVEYFHQDMERAFHHPMGAFATGELEQLFAGFVVERSEVVEDVADFGLERAKLVRFVARKP